MKNPRRIALLLTGLTAAYLPMLTGCGSSDGPRDPPAAQSPDAGDPAGEPATGPGDCGSMEPLLRALPAVNVVDQLPERYRICDSGQYAVSVGFQDEGESPSEYKFAVQLLNANSPYAASAVAPEGATEDQRTFFRNALNAIGEMYKARHKLCGEYAGKPIIPDGRNPLVGQVRGAQVCFMDNLDANREVWNAVAVIGNLGFQIELTGAKAAAITTTAQAQAQLSPLFEKFSFDAVASGP
jgi:hypothetical protein